MEDIEEKYFSKYLSVGAKPAYRDTLAAAASTATREGKVTKKDAVAGSTLKGEREIEREREQTHEILSFETNPAVVLHIWLTSSNTSEFPRPLNLLAVGGG